MKYKFQFGCLLLCFVKFTNGKELRNCATNVAVIICRSNNPTILSENLGERHRATVSLEKKFNRQVQQTLVLLKSIAIAQRFKPKSVLEYFWAKNRIEFESCINFIVVGKDPTIFEEIENEIRYQGWDEEFHNFIKLTFVEATYPKGLEWMEHVYRQCATLRLFLPEILPTIPKLIYVDTDIIFLRPPSFLQSTFDYFSSTQLAALTPELATKNFTVEGLYNPQTYNTGVMLMHLERMRKSKWSSKVGLVAEMVLQKSFYGDQDVLIVYFNFNRDELLHLPCHWNYMPKYCKVDCGQDTGISAIHGVVGSFFIPSGSPFEVLYNYYHKFAMKNFAISTFVSGLGNTLWNRTKISDAHRNYCARLITNEDGMEPTFASSVMKSISSLGNKIIQFPAAKTSILLSSFSKNFAPTKPSSILSLSETRYNQNKTHDNRAGDIVVAITMVESKYKVYNQAELVSVMLKSLFIQSNLQNQMKNKLVLVILTDARSSCEKIDSTVLSWQWNENTLLDVECVVANYTQGFEWMGEVFKPGVFFRLFYPELISYDSVIHVDSDIIFNRHIHDLWSEFSGFNSSHIMAAARQLHKLNASTNPEFPFTSWQAGIMLMNLTRMRSNGWSKTLSMIAQILKPELATVKKILPVQTILHYYFKYHPEEIMEIDFNWNFLPHYCQDHIPSNVSIKPIYAIHGVNNSFVRPDTMEPLFRQIYLNILHRDVGNQPSKNQEFMSNSYKYSSTCSQSLRFWQGWFNT